MKFKYLNKVLLVMIAAVAGLIYYSNQGSTNINNQVVTLTCAERLCGGGTGFAVKAPSGSVYTLTNSHVCGLAQAGQMKAITEAGREQILRVIERSTKYDLCLLTGVTTATGIGVATSKPGRFESVTLIGHPHLEPLTRTYGEITNEQELPVILGTNTPKEECEATGGSYEEALPLTKALTGIESFCVRTFMAVRTTLITYPGNSGSPILDNDNHLVSVLFAGGGGTIWGYGVPYGQIIDFLSVY